MITILPPHSECEGSQRPRKTQSLARRIGPERSEFQAWGDPSPVVWAWGCGEEGRWQLSPPEAPPPRVWVAPGQVSLSNSHASPQLQPQLWPPLGLWPQMLPTCCWQGQQWAPDLCQLLQPQLPSPLAVAAGLFLFFFFPLIFIYLFIWAVLGLHWYMQAFSSCSLWGLLSSCSAEASHCSGFPCFPGTLGALASVVAANGLSCSMACGVLPGQG